MAFRIKEALLATAISLGSIAAPAIAEDSGSTKEGWYGTAGIGYTQLRDADWDIQDSSYKGEVDFDNGFGYQAGVGYDFGKTRLEVGYSQHQGDIDEATEDSGATTTVDGDGSLQSIMLSVYRDFPSESGKLSPYIGAGIGTTNVKADDITVAGTIYGDDDENAFSYQLKAGVSYDMSEKTDVYAEVTYLNVGEVELEKAGNKVDVDTSSVGLFTGIRYQF